MAGELRFSSPAGIFAKPPSLRRGRRLCRFFWASRSVPAGSRGVCSPPSPTAVLLVASERCVYVFRLPTRRIRALRKLGACGVPDVRPEAGAWHLRAMVGIGGEAKNGAFWARTTEQTFLSERCEFCPCPPGAAEDLSWAETMPAAEPAKISGRRRISFWIQVAFRSRWLLRFSRDGRAGNEPCAWFTWA